jgi:uncharacterized Zn-binding protein involved in type VI secretion
MGKPANRRGDKCVVHCSLPTIATGSKTVHINGMPAARLGDKIVPHLMPATPKCVTHPSAIGQGSATVSIEGQPAAYFGCTLVACTSTAMGSPNVFIGP